MPTKITGYTVLHCKWLELGKLSPWALSLYGRMQIVYVFVCTHAGVVRAYDEAWQMDKANCHKYFRWTLYSQLNKSVMSQLYSTQTNLWENLNTINSFKFIYMYNYIHMYKLIYSKEIIPNRFLTLALIQFVCPSKTDDNNILYSQIWSVIVQKRTMYRGTHKLVQKRSEKAEPKHDRNLEMTCTWRS